MTLPCKATRLVSFFKTFLGAENDTAGSVSGVSLRWGYKTGIRRHMASWV